jgi:ligand-binding SRPBCC domain-containing protein
MVASEERWTANVDTINPANERRKYGNALRTTEPSPDWAHTHLRLSSNEGTVAIAVAMTFDQVAG